MPFLLVLLPAWLVLSAGWAIWHYFRQEDQQAAKLDYAYSRMVSESSLADDVHKITTVIGERHPGSETAAKALDQTAAMIAGALGPSNTGLEIRRYATPTRWPILVATIPGSRPKDPALWVVTTYDSRPGSPGTEANATGVAATMATAQQLVGDPLARSIHFAFLPHGNDPDSPILETATRFANLTADAYAILCVDAMASGSDLWLTSRNTESPLLPLLGDLGSIRSAEVTCLHDDTDLASILFELGRPAHRLSTRAQLSHEEPDNAPIRPTLLATSTGRLIAFLRRIAE
jgi:hypothetical protein